MTQPADGASAPIITPERHTLPIRDDVLKAVVVALVASRGEPLVEPARIVLSLSRPAVEAAIGRNLAIEFVRDELNPFGKVELIVQDA